MSTNNPAGLYSQNQGIFNSRPYMLHEQQVQAQKAARDEALNKYYQDLPNRINGAGLDQGDIQGLDNRRNELNKYWVENAAQIKKGNTPEAYNYKKIVSDTFGYVEKGKDKIKNLDAFNKLRNSKDFSHLNKNKEAIEKLRLGTLPMDDPMYSFLDARGMAIPLKDFDNAAYIKKFDRIKPSPKEPRYEAIQGDKFKRLEITDKEFTADKLFAIHTVAVKELDDNPSFEKHIKEKIVGDPSFAQVFEKHYGHKPETDGDFATAYTLSQMDLTPTQKPVTNTQAIQTAQNIESDRRAARNQQYSLEKINANIKNGTNEPTGNSFDETNADFPKTGASIRNGVVRNKDGSLYSGNKLVITKEYLPSSVISSLKSSGYNINLIDNMELNVEGGVIKSMRSSYTGEIGRGNMENYQRKYDTEPLKGTRHKFGNQNKATTIAPKNNAPAQSNNKPAGTRGWKDRATKK
jgi:hypothetical protein